jgi:hypothetical protein
MKQKLLVKYFLISTLLVAVASCLLGLPLDRVNADPPELTPSPAMDIRTGLQPYQTPGIKPSQSDGRLLEEAPLQSEMEEPPIGSLAQQTFYAIADATVLQGYPTVNLGDTADMWAGYDEYLEPDGQIARSLVKFDIASLPPNVDITEATLRVYLVGSWDYPDTSRTITTYRITSSWSESNVTWNNRPGYGSAYGSRSIVSGAWGWYEFDVTNLVSGWYDGTYTNHGVMLRGPEVSGLDSSWRSFGTRESPYTPQLVIEHATSTPPTITGLPDQTLEVNTSLDNAIDLWAYASDAESPDSDLTFTIDNTPDPNAGVSIDSSRYIDINPTLGWTGQTNVTIRVTDPGGLFDTDSFQVTVSPSAPPAITSITPNSGTNDGVVHITNLAGGNFQTGATVKLTKTGETDINATNVVVVSASQITCDFDLTGAATGAWDVAVTNPDSQGGTLPGGFTIDQQAPPEYIVYLPIILKNVGPPSPCPQTGSWSGTTNQGYSISFTVADTPSCQAESLTIAYLCTCTNGSVTTWKTFHTSISISNNHFDTGGSNPRVIGDFTSQTAVSGTWSSSFDDPYMGSCSGSGNWTANYSP